MAIEIEDGVAFLYDDDGNLQSVFAASVLDEPISDEIADLPHYDDSIMAE